MNKTALFGALFLISISAAASYSMQADYAGGYGSCGSGNWGGPGGSYSISAIVGITCSGQAAPVTITYYNENAPAATADIYFVKDNWNTKVFSQQVSGTTVLSFTPDQPGNYELRVSLGTDQKTVDFRVPWCAPQTINATQNITVQLAPSRWLLLYKRYAYAGGFTKEFRVYQILLGQTTSYETDVDLYYARDANATAQSLTIQDSLPNAIVPRSSQVAFGTYPDNIGQGPGPSMLFDWNGGQATQGTQLHFSYHFARQTTEQMLDGIAAPRAFSTGQDTLVAGLGSQLNAGQALLASLFWTNGNGPFGAFSRGQQTSVSLLLAIGLVALALFLVYAFAIERQKKEQEEQFRAAV